MLRFEKNLLGKLRDIERFARRVEKNVKHFNGNTINKLLRDFSKEGVKELHALFTYLSKQHYPGAKQSSDIPRILNLELQRHVNRWNANIASALATAKDSIPEFRNRVRARDEDGTRASILARLDKALGGQGFEPELDAAGGRRLYGKARLNSKRTGKKLIRLVPYLKTLLHTTPTNFINDYKMSVMRIARKSGDKLVIRISPGVQANSCSTCRSLNGRVLTQDAVKYATTRLNPQLFHPNCMHSIQTQGLQGVTPLTYDPSTFGELITLPVLHRMIAAGELTRGRARKAFVRV